MDVLAVLRLATLGVCLFAITGCQIPYLIQSAIDQGRLLGARQPIDKVLQAPSTSLETKRKLQLAMEARQFAETELGLKPTKNYQQYVELGRPYVTYIVHAAPVFKLEHHLWWFPIVGNVPYKGFFSRKDADSEAARFAPDQYDTYVRGVSAYSTLGWFSDPLLSSMLAYQDADLVNTIIHETVHATVYVRSHADFNEQLATFLGDWGTELFYLKKEGASSSTLQQIHTDRADQRVFSDFLKKEMDSLKEWYVAHSAHTDLGARQERLRQIQERFQTSLRTQLKTTRFAKFADEPLNNAKLLAYSTYFMDLSQFEAAREKIGGDFRAFLNFCLNLSRSDKPPEELKAFLLSR